MPYYLPKIFISFFISHIMTIINILQVKIQPTSSLASTIASNVKRNLVIKYVIFFILGILFLWFFWMLLSSFGAVFQNTQITVFENAMISFGVSFIYPFFINLIPCILRIQSLSSKSEYIYNFSKVLQLL